MAFYLPFHQYQMKNFWGIYLVSYWVRNLGIRFHNYGNSKNPGSVSLTDGIKAAELFLYYILIDWFNCYLYCSYFFVCPNKLIRFLLRNY